MAIVTVHNRYREPFVGMFDGQEYILLPGKDVALPDYIARQLRKQSIVRDNPVTGDNDYLLAIIEDGDPTEPIESKPIDPFDRSDSDWAKTKVIPSGIRQVRPRPREDMAAAHDVSTKERE